MDSMQFHGFVMTFYGFPYNDWFPGVREGEAGVRAMVGRSASKRAGQSGHSEQASAQLNARVCEKANGCGKGG